MSAFDPNVFFAEGNQPPAAKHLGWRLLDFDIERGWIKVGFSAKPEFLNPMGNIQGGFLLAMLDDTMGPAAVIKSRGAQFTQSLDIHAHYLRPIKAGDITAEGEVTKLGRSVAFMEGRLFDAEGNLCTRAVSSAKLTALP